MSRSEDSANGDASEETDSAELTPGDAPAEDGAADWVAVSTFRIALAILGLVLLLFGLGRVVGVDFLQLVADAMATPMGRWLAVAVVGLVLIGIAARGFGRARAR